MCPHTVLIADDSAADRELYKSWLEGHFNAIEAYNGNTAINQCLEASPSCIVMDFLMANKDGFQAMIELRQDFKNETPIIFITDYPSREIAEDALALGASYFADKSDLTQEKLVDAVKQCISPEIT